jgi:histidyl-tRNA synthetase
MSTSISFNAPRGMRDFYPEDMRLRNRIFDAWRASASASGFEPFDACVVESLEVLERKAGEEIVNQIYAFKDKSGRDLALRPEVTPSLARMIVGRQGELSMPLKWFTVAQCFRYERMTRGRKREHYQWNLDIVGSDSIAAEAEILVTAMDALRRMGVPDDAYRVRLSSRELLSELLVALGIGAEQHAAVFLALDKRGKLPDDEIRALLSGEGLDDEACAKAFSLLEIQTLDDAAKLAGGQTPAIRAIQELFELLRIYGVAEQVVFDIAVVRGLAYYTGIVFEAFDCRGKFRAIFGGGRYDGLLATLGGKPTTAVGMGFGDVVVAELLADLQGDAANTSRDGVIIGYMTDGERAAATALAAKLRKRGDTVALQLAPQKPKAFFRTAAGSIFAEAVFIGPDDVAENSIKLKNLDTREETTLPLQ